MNRIICIGILLVAMAGCASLDEGYTTRYGLTNPESSLVPPTPTDETYQKGSVGQEYLEEYDKKYHEKDVLSPAPGTSEENTAD